MEKFNSKVLGPFIIWKDFIKFNNGGNGEVSYKQSNTKLAGFMDRYIGLSIIKNNILISVAVSNGSNKKESDKTARNVIEQRMISLVNKEYNIDPEDRGITYVPKEMLDMLWKDPYTFKNLFGAVDPTYIGMAVKSV